MNQLPPPTTAIGACFDEQMEIASLAHRYYEEEGCPEGRALEHWLRAEHELHGKTTPPHMDDTPPTPEDLLTEEAMHLDL